MATAIIYVFSGTGNTLETAKMIKSSLESRDVATTIYDVNKPYTVVPSPANYDYAGFGYPVHAFNCPRIFLDFAKNLPTSANKRAFIFKTSGEPFRFNDASSYRLYKSLKRKGFDVAIDKHLLMPYNIMFRYKDSLVKQMLRYNDALCDLLVTRLISGDRDNLRYHLRHRILSVIFRIQQFGAVLNGHFYSVNRKKCTMCMRCVDKCPAQNISLSGGRLRFGGRCTMCMRCVMYCPANAVNPGILRQWKVNGAYDFARIQHDAALSSDFINENTKGYFRLFIKYYRNANKQLEKYEANLPDNKRIL